MAIDPILQLKLKKKKEIKFSNNMMSFLYIYTRCRKGTSGVNIQSEVYHRDKYVKNFFFQNVCVWYDIVVM